MRVTTPLYRMTEHMVGGDLAGILKRLRAQGHSWESVARRLHAEYGVEVTQQTLRLWGQQLGIEPAEATA